jgi:hypothetical protein
MNDLERKFDHRYRLIQLVYNVLFLLFWYFSNAGLAFWDDFTYLHFANQINFGLFEVTTNHFTSRVGLIYPVSYVINWFGINPYTITLVPLISGLGILNLIMWFGKRNGVWLGVFGGLMIICDYHFLHLTTHLFPEIPIAFCILLGLMSYDLVNRKEGDHRFLALLTAASIFYAYLIKTTVFLIIPLFLYLFFNDWLRRKKNQSFWLITITCLLFFLVLNLFHYYETKGDAFYRLNNISGNHEPSVKTFFDKPWSETIKRLTYLPFIGFMRGGFFIPFLVALPSIISLKKKDWRLDDPTKLWPVASLLILVSWWFISTNWKYYSPLPVDTRHITFVIPVFILSGGFWWLRTSIFKSFETKGWPLLIALLLFLIPTYKISIAEDRNFKALDALFAEEILPTDRGLKKAAIVYTDGLISYGYPYFYQFRKANLHYVWWSEYDPLKIKAGDYVLINPAYMNERYDDYNNLEKIKAVIAEKSLVLDCTERSSVGFCKVRP